MGRPNSAFAPIAKPAPTISFNPLETNSSGSTLLFSTASRMLGGSGFMGVGSGILGTGIVSFDTDSATVTINLNISYFLRKFSLLYY